jgi:predicted PurR-regulated permease PerM
MRSKAETPFNMVWGVIVRTALAIAVLYILWRVRSVLVTVLLAVMLAYVLVPAVDFLCRRRFLPLSKRGTRLIATILVFLVFFLVVGVGFRLLVNPFELEARKFMEKINDYTKTASHALDSAMTWYRTNVPKDLQDFLKIPDDWRDLLKTQEKGGATAAISDYAKALIGGTLAWTRRVIELILIPVLAFYFVLDSRRLKREFIALVPPWRVREALRVTREVNGILQNYVIGQLILCLIAGVVTGIVLHLAGINYALVLAVFAGITRAIPIIGPVASGIPICILGALQGGVGTGLWLLVFVTIMHFAESKFIMPILIGDRLKLHPAVILIALLIGAELFGLLGMFLAAPIAAIARELLYLYVIRPRRRKAANHESTDKMTTTLVRPERT